MIGTGRECDGLYCLNLDPIPVACSSSYIYYFIIIVD